MWSQIKRNRAAGVLDADAYAAAEAEVGKKLVEASAIRARTQRQLDAAALAHYASEADRLAHLLRRNPRKFFRVLRTKLPHLDVWTDRRRAIACAYAERLRDSGLILPYIPNWAEPTWHLYVVRSPDRCGLQKRLAEAGVGTLIHYPIPPHMQEAYADLGLAPDALPLARDLAREVLSLPIGPQLLPADAAQVIDVVRAAD